MFRVKISFVDKNENPALFWFFLLLHKISFQYIKAYIFANNTS